MAGFSDGFNSTLNLMLSAQRVGLYKEELEEKRKKEERLAQPIEELSPGAAADLGVEADTTLDQAATISNIQAQQANIQRSEAQTKEIDKRVGFLDERERLDNAVRQSTIDANNLKNKSTEQQIEAFGRTMDSQQDFENAVFARDTFNIIAELAENPEMAGTPTYDAMLLEAASLARKGIEQGAIDIAEALSPGMQEAISTLAPLMNGLRKGLIQDPSEIVLGDYSESLNKLFNVKKNKYLGKTYIAEDGTKGEITGLDIDFNTFEIEAGSERSGGKAIIKGVFTYVTPDGETKQSNPSFIPDASKAVIRETQRGSDAFAVSLTDMVDIAASTESMIATAVNTNPEMFRVAADLRKNNIDNYARNAEGQVSINQKVSEIFQKNAIDLGDTLARNNLTRQFKNIGGGPDTAVRESEALYQFAGAFPKILKDIDVIQGGSKEAEDLGLEGDGVFYRLKRNKDGSLVKTLNQALIDTLPTRAEIEINLKKGTPFEETPVEFADSFNFKGQPINRGLSKEVYLPIIKEKYPDRDIDALVQQFRTSFANNPRFEGRTLSDAALLDLLHGMLER